MLKICSNKYYQKLIILGVVGGAIILTLFAWLSTRLSPTQQLLAIDAARAIGDEHNAAVRYRRIMEMSPELDFSRDFNEPHDSLTFKYPWRTKDHPDIAEWISARQHILTALQEAS